MQPQNQAIIDSAVEQFNNTICKWSKDDIEDPKPMKTKTMFYSHADYTQSFNDHVYAQAKNQIAKKMWTPAPTLNSTYMLKGVTLVNSFWTMEFFIDSAPATESKDGEATYTHNVQLNDYVLVSPTEGEKSEKGSNCYFFGVVNALRSGLLVIQTVLDRHKEDPLVVNRLQALEEYAMPDSKWTVHRMASASNWHRSYISAFNVADLGPISQFMLDPTHDLEQEGKSRHYALSNTSEFSNPRTPQCLIKEGIALAEGGYYSGKTSLVPEIVSGYMKVSKEAEEEAKRAEEKKANVKKYSIAEILAGEDDSSSDEEEESSSGMNQFPWLKKDYLNIYDDLAFDHHSFNVDLHCYPKASVTDRKVDLRVKDNSEAVPLPRRYLVVEANNGAVDKVISKFDEQLEGSLKKGQLVRLTQSASNNESNAKYSLDNLAGTLQMIEKQQTQKSSEIAAQILEKRMATLDSAQIVVAPLSSLLSSGVSKTLLDKYFQTKFYAEQKVQGFDTVIVDDAQLMDETDVLQACLRYGCRRLILLGNPDLGQATFRLCETKQDYGSAKHDLTLFGRVCSLYTAMGFATIKLESGRLKPLEPEPPAKPQKKSAAKASTRKGRGKKQADEDAVMEDLESPSSSFMGPGRIIFVDVTEGKEVQKKGSTFTNNKEAEAVIDYFITAIQKNKEYLKNPGRTVAMTSPFRTQAHQIRSKIYEQAKALNFKSPDLADEPVVIQEVVKIKKRLAKVFGEHQKLEEIGSLEELVSNESCHTLLLSLCRTEKFQDELPEEACQESILNRKEVINFIRSRVTGTLVVFGKGKMLNELWKKEILSKVCPADLIEI